MPKRLNLVGTVIGRLTVVEPAGIKVTPSGVRRTLWRCVCSCGGETTISAKVIAARTSQSCGCLQRERVSQASGTHRASRTKMYKVWTAMKQRCHNPNDAGYAGYGARGITVCERWRNSFEAFIEDVGQPPAPGLSLDRIDGTRGYEPRNVRWATASQQLSNTTRTRHITHGGETLTMKQWSERASIPYATLKQRLDNGMPIGEALTRPINLKYSNTHRSRSAMSSDVVR